MRGAALTPMLITPVAQVSANSNRVETDPFRLSGYGLTCEISKNWVDKVTYTRAGTTQSGSPYYDATGEDGTGTYYMYWDPDMYGGDARGQA